MNKIAVIVAGGEGLRMGTTVPKQFLLIQQKPILYYTLNAFFTALPDMEMVLVLPTDYIARGQEIIDAYFDATKITVTEGGRSRFHSVQNGLKLINKEAIVFVHDAVRCCVTPTLIQNCYTAAVEYGSALPVINCNDSLRIVHNEDGNSEAFDRTVMRIVQTPQTFHSKIILPAFEIDFKDKFTDEATVVEAFGLKIHLVDGEVSNIKITTPTDLVLAEALLQSTNNY
jgi:2-C-methyl-D-erythritol 4-phosphate cytidylyltransferase